MHRKHKPQRLYANGLKVHRSKTQDHGVLPYSLQISVFLNVFNLNILL